MDKRTHTEKIEMNSRTTQTVPTHIMARITAGRAAGLLPKLPTRIQILSTIGDSRYLSAATAHLRTEEAAAALGATPTEEVAQ